MDQKEKTKRLNESIKQVDARLSVELNKSTIGDDGIHELRFLYSMFFKRTPFERVCIGKFNHSRGTYSGNNVLISLGLDQKQRMELGDWIYKEKDKLLEE